MIYFADAPINDFPYSFQSKEHAEGRSSPSEYKLEAIPMIKNGYDKNQLTVMAVSGVGGVYAIGSLVTGKLMSKESAIVLLLLAIVLIALFASLPPKERGK